MFIVRAHKKLSALLLCTLLMAQPLKPMISDKGYNDAIFYLFFFGGCALLGILHSHVKKIDALMKKIPDEREEKISSYNEKTKKTNRKIPKQDNDLPFVFKQLKDDLTKRIENLEQRCKALTEQNSQLLITTKNMQRGINGYVPAFVAALWFNKYTEQTTIINNYKQNILDKNCLALLNNQ